MGWPNPRSIPSESAATSSAKRTFSPSPLMWRAYMRLPLLEHQSGVRIGRAGPLAERDPARAMQTAMLNAWQSSS